MGCGFHFEAQINKKQHCSEFLCKSKREKSTYLKDEILASSLLANFR